MGNRGNLLATKATLWPISPSNHRQPLVSWSVKAHFSLATGSCQRVTKQFLSMHELGDWLNIWQKLNQLFFLFSFSQSSEVEHDGRGLGTRPEQLASEWRNMVWALENNSKAFKNSTCYKYRLFFFVFKETLVIQNDRLQSIIKLQIKLIQSDKLSSTEVAIANGHRNKSKLLHGV